MQTDVDSSKRWDLDFDPNSTPATEDSEEPSISSYVESHGKVSRVLRENNLHHPLSLEPLALASGMYSPNVGEFLAVTDTATGFVLGKPIKRGYTLVQPTAIASMLDAVVADMDIDAKDISIVSWGGGTRLAFRIPIEVKIGDLTAKQRAQILAERKKFNVDVHGWDDKAALVAPHESFIVVQNSHGAAGGFNADFEARYVACDNGLIRKITGKGFRFRHDRNLADRIEQLRKAFERTKIAVARHRDLMFAMFSTPLDGEAFDKLIAKLFPEAEEDAGDITKANVFERREEFRRLHEEAPGASPNSVLGAVMTGSYWTSNVEGVNVTRTMNRFSLDETERPQLMWEARYGLQLFGRSRKFNDRVMQWATVQLQAN